MSEPRFTTLTPETMTADQKRVADAIQSGPRGAGLRGPFNALLRSPELCDLVQRVGAYVRFGSSIPPRLNEIDGAGVGSRMVTVLLEQVLRAFQDCFNYRHSAARKLQRAELVERPRLTRYVADRPRPIRCGTQNVDHGLPLVRDDQHAGRNLRDAERLLLGSGPE